MRQIDYGTLTPLEYLSLGDRERIHTETLRWLLSKDSALIAPSRIRLLSQIAGADLSGARIMWASSEHQHIDLLVRLDREGHPITIAIENKLKSAEHSSQLRRYDAHLSEFGTCGKVFLTLIEQRPYSSSAWIPFSYSELLRAIDAEISVPANVRGNREFVADYVAALSRLVAAVERVITLPDSYAGNGAVFPFEVSEQRPADFETFASYVRQSRLRTVLQKAWMLELGKRVADSSALNDWDVGETHGAAHLGFKLRSFEHLGVQLDVGLQIQNRAFKIYCAPSSYRRGATADTHRAVDSAIRVVRANIGMESSRITSPRDKGFRSFMARQVAPQSTLLVDRWRACCDSVLSQLKQSLGDLS